MKSKLNLSETNIKQNNLSFFDFWAGFYDYTFFIKPWLRNIQKKVVSNIPLNKNLKILDIGCGTGDSLLFLSELNHPNLFGVDISENMLKVAKKKLNNKAILKIAEVENLPFNKYTFDYVLCTEAFHHFPDPNKSIKEANRVLKKDAIFLLADVNFHSKLIHKLFKLLEPGHVKIYNKNEFKELFEKNNFKVINQKNIGLFSILTIGKKIK